MSTNGSVTPGKNFIFTILLKKCLNSSIFTDPDSGESQEQYRDRIIKYVDNFDFSNYCPLLTKLYEKIGKIGHGTYG